MSNEYKDWYIDKIYETMLDAGVVDRIEEVCSAPYSERRYVHGWKGKEKVIYAVWLDDDGEWKYIHIS